MERLLYFIWGCAKLVAATEGIQGSLHCADDKTVRCHPNDEKLSFGDPRSGRDDTL